MPMVEPEVIMDGSHDIDDLLRGHRGDAAFAVRLAVRAQRHARRHHPEGLDGRAGHRPAARRPAVEEVAAATLQCLKSTVPAIAAGHRVPVGRPERRGRHRAPQRDEPHGPEPVAAVVLLRPRHAVGRAEAVVAGPGQQLRQGAADRVRARPRQRPGRARPVEEGGVSAFASAAQKTPALCRRFFCRTLQLAVRNFHNPCKCLC